jgi:N-acetylmuramoyl-L-alanine amidase
MIERIYLTPSPQEYNVGVNPPGPGTYGTERDRCFTIGRITADLLRQDPDIRVRVASKWWSSLPYGIPMRRAVAASNLWGAHLHIPIHTNAGTQGTMTGHAKGSAEGKRLAECIQRKVAPVSPGRDGGVVVWDFYELNATKATAAYCELADHTYPDDALSIMTQPGLYALALAEGIFDDLHKPYPWAEPKPSPKPDKNPTPKPRPPWWRVSRLWLRLKKKH